MIILVKPAPYGGNAIRYALDKDKAEKIAVNHLPDDITATAIWDRMKLHCKMYENLHTNGRPMKNFMVTFVISPSPEESAGWTKNDFARLHEEVLKEIDSVDITDMPKCKKARSTNFVNSMNVSSLHHDSKSGVLHMHLDACRLDMQGNTNDLHQIFWRCRRAAKNINRRHGWKDPEDIREERRKQVSVNCLDVLRQMEKFELVAYFTSLKGKGYKVNAKTDSKGMACGYTIGFGASTFKASVLGVGRNLTISRLEATWHKMHQESHLHSEGKRLSEHRLEKSGSLPRDFECLDNYAMEESDNNNLVHSENIPSVGTPETYQTENIPVGKTNYICKVPKDIMDFISQESEDISDEILESASDIANTAVLLFSGYIQAALVNTPSYGGGSNSSLSGWGRKKDDDDWSFARRCLNQAKVMHTRVRRTFKR